MSTKVKENDRCPKCNHFNAMLWVTVWDAEYRNSTRHLACRDCGHRDAKDWTPKEYRETFNP